MTRSGAYRSSAIAAFGLAVVLMGCGGRESQSPSTAPPTTAMIGPTVPPAGPTTLDPRAGDKARLTASQAFTLSRMLVKNEQAKGAAAEMVVQSGSAEKFTLRGSVDWAGDEGSFVMSIIGSDGVTVPESRVIWDRGSLFTEVAGLEKAMEAKGRPGVTFVQRALDPQTVSLDALVAFVGSLAVDRAENPILPHLDEIIIGLIAFGLLCYVLMSRVFPKMEETFRERQSAIEGGI